MMKNHLNMHNWAQIWEIPIVCVPLEFYIIMEKEELIKIFL